MATTLIRAKLGDQEKGSCTTADWLAESKKSHLDSLLDSRGHGARRHRIKMFQGNLSLPPTVRKTLPSTGNGPSFQRGGGEPDLRRAVDRTAKLPGTNSRNPRQLGTLSNSCSKPLNSLSEWIVIGLRHFGRIEVNFVLSSDYEIYPRPS